MIIKTYKANTNVSINVVLPSNKNLHITFTPLSNGSSTFTTDKEEIQNAIERHYNFGKLFRLIRANGEATKGTVSGMKLTTPKVEKTGDNSDEPKENSEAITDAPAPIGVDENAEAGTGMKNVKVSDLASAKDYLADKFGVSRTTLRSQKAIMEQAAMHGIEFVGMS